MYQEEIFSNVMTESGQVGYENLTHEIRGMEAAIERFFKMILENTTALSERDFNVDLF